MSYTDENTPKSRLASWTVLSVTTLGAFMASLDSNIVAIALPKIGADLASGVSLLGWVITGYILTTAMLLLQSGKLGDRYGKKRIYLWGFAIFGAASAFCGTSQSIYELIAFRVLQGVGAAIINATTLPLIFESFPPKLRGAAVGINSAAWGVGAISGPVVGGFLVALDWRFIFYINVPIAAAAVIIGLRRIPELSDSKESRTKSASINIISSVLLALTVALALLWLTFLQLIFALAALGSLVGLITSEVKSKDPLIKRGLRENRGFIYSIIAVSLQQVAFLGIPFVLSIYFQSVEHLSPVLAGLSIAPLPIALAIFQPISGRLFDKIKTPALISILGAIVGGASTIALSVLLGRPSSPTIYFTIVLIFVGMGDGLFWPPSISSVLRFSKPELRGVANGTAFTMINIGFATSIAIAVAVSATFLPSSIVSQIFFGSLTNLSGAEAALFREGLSRALLVLGCINLIPIPIMVFVQREQRMW